MQPPICLVRRRIPWTTRAGVSAADLELLLSQSRNQGRRAPSRGQSDATSQTKDPVLAESGSNGSRKPKQQQRRARRPRYEEKPPELASGVHGRLAEAVMLEAESDEGNVEYKLRLKQPNPVRFQQLVTQMKYRLSEGNGECFYYIGVEDDGYPRGLSPQDLDTSLHTLTAMTESVNAALQPLREMPASKGRSYLIVRVHRICQDELSYTDLRIAVAGSVDSGKSTLVAVLTHGQKGRPLLDDGHGSARMSVLKHKHEIETGRTSSLSHHTLAYDRDAGVLNYAGVAPMMPSEIAAAAAKVLRFVDLGGHQKYLKTALYGMTSLLPDFLLLCVCPLLGLTRVTREHFAIALALELPLAVVVTKVDVVQPSVVQTVLAELQQMFLAARSGIQAQGLRALGGPDDLCYTLIRSEGQAAQAAQDVTGKTASQPIVPIFTLASTTGLGLPILHTFLSHLEPAYQHSSSSLDSQDASIPAVSKANGALDTHVESGCGQPVTAFETLAGASAMDTPGPGSGGRGQSLAASWRPNDLHPGVASATLSMQLLDPALGTGRRAAGRPGESPPGAPAHFQVDQTFEVRGVGSVVSGTLVAGEIALGQHMLLGPDDTGDFTTVEVTSIQRSQVPVQRIRVGQHATLAIHVCVSQLCEALAEPSAANSVASLVANAATVKRSQTQRASSDTPRISSEWNRAERNWAEESETDIRHDTWREPRQACKAGNGPEVGSTAPKGIPTKVTDRRLAFGGSRVASLSRSSFSGGSDQGDSPRVGLATQLSQRLSAEEALTAMSTLRNEGMAGEVEECKPEAQPRTAAPSLCPSNAVLGAAKRPGSGMTEAPGGASDDDPLQPWAESPNENVSAPGSRKGTVLLDGSLRPSAVWQFEAVMVLLSGFWPPRGLLSGSWPPHLDSDVDDALSDSSMPFDSPAASFDRLRSPSYRGGRNRHRFGYTPVVHCGSVRQAARVMSMAEVPLAEGWTAADACRATGCNLVPAVAAAASLLAQPTSCEGPSPVGSCVAVVVFRFTHRPEWLQEGSRLVVRDRTESCTAGAGVVRSMSFGTQLGLPGN